MGLNRFVARICASGIPKRSARRTTAIEVSRLMRMADMISGDLISPANSAKDVTVRRQESTIAIKPKKMPAIRDNRIRKEELISPSPETQLHP